jgi:cell division septation protein DedD
MDLGFYRALGGSRAGAGAPATLLPGDEPRQERGTGDLPGTGGAFVVQAMATRDGAAARRLRDRLAARGLPAVLVEGRAGGSAIYRVRVGRYRERRAAEAVARRIREEQGLVTWVLREAT